MAKGAEHRTPAGSAARWATRARFRIPKSGREWRFQPSRSPSRLPPGRLRLVLVSFPGSHAFTRNLGWPRRWASATAPKRRPEPRRSSLKKTPQPRRFFLELVCGLRRMKGCDSIEGRAGRDWGCDVATPVEVLSPDVGVSPGTRSRRVPVGHLGSGTTCIRPRRSSWRVRRIGPRTFFLRVGIEPTRAGSIPDRVRPSDVT